MSLKVKSEQGIKKKALHCKINTFVVRCNLTRDGKEALIKLSGGDMRRALNVLQACHAAYDKIDQVTVYNCTGNPLPADVEKIVDTMMNGEFTTAYKCEFFHLQKLVFFRTSC